MAILLIWKLDRSGTVSVGPATYPEFSIISGSTTLYGPSIFYLACRNSRGQER